MLAMNIGHKNVHDMSCSLWHAMLFVRMNLPDIAAFPCYPETIDSMMAVLRMTILKFLLNIHSEKVILVRHQ